MGQPDAALPEIYVLPGSVATDEAAEQVKAKLADVSVAQLHAVDGTRGVLYSAIFDPAFGTSLFSAILRRRRFRGRSGELVGSDPSFMAQCLTGGQSSAEIRRITAAGQSSHDCQ